MWFCKGGWEEGSLLGKMVPSGVFLENGVPRA
jgi:hypothetical protein